MATDVESLYPFLSSQRVDRARIRDDIRRSTAAKVAEVVTLRRLVAETLGPAMVDCAVAMAEQFARGGRLYAFGNGGSSCDAQAVAQLYGNPRDGRPLPAMALTNDIATLTALANDVGFEVIFARQLEALGQAGDMAIGLSTSGGSTNVLRGFEQARRRGLLTVGLAGYEGGQMAEAQTIDHLFVVPSSSVHRIQEVQTTIYNVLWELTQRALA